MDKETIFSKLKKILDDQGADTSEIKPASTFKDDLKLDSLDLVEVILALEEAYEIKVPDEDAESLITVDDAVNYIAGKL